jgi:hypothetical protein
MSVKQARIDGEARQGLSPGPDDPRGVAAPGEAAAPPA